MTDLNDNRKEKLEKFIKLTDKIAKRSKDQSTKVGALFLNKSETAPRSFGYNGMPRGLDDENVERNERPEKYFWYEHAERNGIYNIARETLTGHVIYNTHMPNMEGARAIVSSGLKKVIVKDIVPEDLSPEELAMFKRVTALFQETGVEFININSYEVESSPDKKVLRKHLENLEMVEDYANDFSPSRGVKSGSMMLNEITFAPIENGFGVYAPPEVIVNVTEEMHEDKQFWFQESEKNAIFNSVRDKFEGTTAVTCWCPCIHCSLAIVSVACDTVVTRKFDFTQEADQRWKESFERTEHLFKVTNTELILLDVPKPEVKPVNKNKIK